LNGGIRLAPGLYAFTDANAVGGVGVVIVSMPGGESSEPVILEPKCSSSVVRIVKRTPIGGVAHLQVVDAVCRLRNILAEMVALYEALNQLTAHQDVAPGSQIRVVHDYFGVSAWMQAGAPPGASVRIDPGYYDAPSRRMPGVRPRIFISAVISACWKTARQQQLELVFRHQPGHRSEEAGTHHFVRFNKMADQLADRGSKPSAS
jgi:hypothetical protein